MQKHEKSKSAHKKARIEARNRDFYSVTHAYINKQLPTQWRQLSKKFKAVFEYLCWMAKAFKNHITASQATISQYLTQFPLYKRISLRKKLKCLRTVQRALDLFQEMGWIHKTYRHMKTNIMSVNPLILHEATQAYLRNMLAPLLPDVPNFVRRIARLAKPSFFSNQNVIQEILTSNEEMLRGEIFYKGEGKEGYSPTETGQIIENFGGLPIWGAYHYSTIAYKEERTWGYCLEKKLFDENILADKPTQSFEELLEWII